MNNEVIKKQSDDLKIKREAALTKQVSSSLLCKLKTFSSEKALLIDISGSMDDPIGTYGSETRYTVMKNVLKDLIGYRRFAFSTNCNELRGEELPTPSGGTNLGGAFQNVKSHEVRHIILVTDGRPDSQAHALNEAKDLKIDIVYIGPDPIPEFLQKLAKMSDGKFENIKLLGDSSKSLLESSIKGLLNS